MRRLVGLALEETARPAARGTSQGEVAFQLREGGCVQPTD